jgi:hypothetical protein
MDIQDVQCMYDVTVWRLCINIIAMETQKCGPFALLTRISRCQQCSVEGFAIEAEQCVVCVVTLQMSLPAT